MLRKLRAIPVIVLFGLCACGGGGEGNGAQQPPVASKTYAISGHVIGTSGAVVTARGAKEKATATDSAGNFTITDLGPGQYSIAPTQPGSNFNPIEQSVTVANADVSGLVFESQQGEGLTPEEAQKLDSEPDTVTPSEQILLPNGQSLRDYAKSRGYDLDAVPEEKPSVPQEKTGATAPAGLPEASGPQEKRNDVVMQMIGTARKYACGRASPPCTTWDHQADSADPINKPAQKGLTYVYGGKTPNVRTKPLDGCPQLTYGLDCSGLVQRVASAAGITAPGTSALQANPDNWKIPEAYGLKLVKVTSSMQAGDIALWASHAGIVTNSSEVVSATGSRGDCLKNVASPRGPRSLTVAQLGLGAPTTVLRVVAPLSGDWRLDIRCSDQRTDAASIKLKIDNDVGGAFSATGSGTDYNGAPLSFNLNGTYDQAENVLTATLSFVDNSRSDSFTQKLLTDEIGYFPLTKLIDNGGCQASAKLSRLQSSPQAPSQKVLTHLELFPRPIKSRLGGLMN